MSSSGYSFSQRTLPFGNLAGGRSRFSVGYPPHIPESWERTREELAEVQETLKKLWAAKKVLPFVP